MLSIIIADMCAFTAAGLVFILWRDNHQNLMEELKQLEMGIE